MSTLKHTDPVYGVCHPEKCEIVWTRDLQEALRLHVALYREEYEVAHYGVVKRDGPVKRKDIEVKIVSYPPKAPLEPQEEVE